MLDPSTSRGSYAVTHFLLGLTAPIVERLREWSKKLRSHEKHEGLDPFNDFRNSAGRERFDDWLRLIFDSIPALIHTTRPDGYIDYFNQNWLAYLGRSLEDIQGWKWTSSIHPDDVEGILKRWRASLATGEPFLYETRVRRADGEFRWMLHQKVPLRDEHGTIIKWYGSSIDIEDRKLAELSAIIENAPVFLWSDLPDGYCDFLNQPWLTYFNLPLQEAQGAGWTRVLHPDDAAHHLESWKKSVSQGIPFETEARYRRPDGEYRWFLNRANPLRDKTGKIVKWYGTNIDIENLKRTEGRLRQSEAYLAKGQRLAHMGSWAFDAAGFEYWSPELFRIHGLDPDNKAPTIQEYLDCVHPQDRESMANLIKGILAEPSSFDATKRIVRPDGEVRYIRCVGAPVVENQRLTKYVGSAIDVTEQELLTQELRSREAYLTEAQRLSHTGSFGWKPDSGDIVWSDETYRIFEYDRAVKPTIDLVVQRVHPEDRVDFLNVIDRASAGVTHFEHAYRLLLPDGRVKHVHALAHTLQDASGNSEFVGAVMDVTERTRAEETVRASEHRFRLAVESIPGLITIMNAKGEIEVVNGQVLNYFGKTLEEVKSWGTTDAVHPDDLPRVLAEWKHAIETEQPYDIENRLRRADGMYRWFHARGLPLRDDEGRIVRWYNLLTDTDDRKNAEAMLAEEKRILEMVAKGDSLEQILERLCRLVEEQAQGVLASVLLVQNGRLMHGGAPSLPKAYMDAVDGIAIGPTVGSCGTAAYRGEQVIVSDIATDPLWANYRETALSHSLRACWSTPVFSSQGKVIATFAMYYREPRSPSQREQDIIEQITQLAGVAIERKLTQEALRASELNFRRIVDGIPGLVYTLTADGEVEFVNQQILNYTGKTFEELKRWETTDPDLIHPDDVQKLIAARKRTLETGQPHTVEHRLRRADGVYRWFDLSRLAQRDSQGHVLRWYVLLSDIHERKQAARGAALLSSIVASSDDAIISKDLSGTITSWNRGAKRIFGYTAEEMIGSSILQLIPPEQHSEETAILSKLRRGERVVHYETIRRKKDGRLCEVSLTISPMLDEHGNVIGASKIARDITEQKRAELRLLAQYTVTQILADAVTLEEATVKILRAICESLEWDVGALWRVDREEGVLRCVRIWHKESVQVPEFEEASRNTTFLPGIGLPGRVWFRREPLYIPDVVRDSNFPRAPIVSRGILHAGFGFPILFRGDVLGVMEFFSHEIKQPDQELLDMMATVGTQIGQFIERKRAEEAFRTAQMELAHVTRVATLGEMTASIAHEINQPLGAIVNNAGASLRWLAAQNMDEVRQSIEHVIKDGHRASDIISRIRALVKKTPPQKEGLDVNNIVREIITLARAELDEHHVALQVHVSDEVPAVLGDRIQLQQVLLNLIMNAIEAMSGAEGSRMLRVGAALQDKRHVLVTVQDSGPGLDPTQLNRLFEAFYSTKPGGLGMGLAISRSIIEAHDGRLWATTNEDRGATLHFTLPIGEERPA
jgi:PAS domain S-box-containing protein